MLSERRSRVVFRDELFREVWGFLDTSTTRSVDRAVSRLRQKIEADPRTPRFLRTVHGDGYILTPEAVILERHAVPFVPICPNSFVHELLTI